MSTDLKLQVLLAEHKSIRDEISSHKATQQTVLNFIFIVMGAQVALVPQLRNIDARYVVVLLLLPVPFALLSLYHSAYTIRIHNLANYLDNELRSKIELLVGSNTLRSHSFIPTKRPWQLLRARSDGRLTYIALLGLKALPQVVPLGAFLVVRGRNWAWWESLWFGADLLLLLISSVGQHD